MPSGERREWPCPRRGSFLKSIHLSPKPPDAPQLLSLIAIRNGKVIVFDMKQGFLAVGQPELTCDFKRHLEGPARLLGWSIRGGAYDPYQPTLPVLEESPQRHVGPLIFPLRPMLPCRCMGRNNDKFPWPDHLLGDEEPCFCIGFFHPFKAWESGQPLPACQGCLSMRTPHQQAQRHQRGSPDDRA